MLLVGTGPPAPGGISTFLEWALRSELASEHELSLLNLTRVRPREGGRLSLANVRRTVEDAVEVWRRSPDVDLVHIHSALAPAVTLVRAGALALAARARGRPVVIHAHGGRFQLWLEGRLKRALTRCALAPATRVVSVSESVHVALRTAVRAPKLSVIENGVDLDTYRPVTARERGRRVLYVGALTPRKGVLDLLRASELLRARGLEHELWLAGGAPDDGAAAEAEVRRAAEGATVLGAVAPSAMPDIYREGDVFCLPSWWEAMPFSVLEAMASGLPIVASRVGDIPLLVEDGVSGILVPPRNVEALATALERLLEDRRTRELLGSAARQRVAERFSSRRTAAGLRALYAELEDHQ